MEKIYIRAYRAIDEEDCCNNYLEGHVQVLKDHGITNITSNNDSWKKHINTYCVIASLGPELVGGIRVTGR